MATGTHTLLERITVGSAGAASITFSSIPANYTDLYLKLSLRSGRSAYRSAGAIQFNADTGVTRYSYRRLYASGTTPGSDSSTSSGFILIGEIVAASSTASTFTNTEVYISNYTSTNAKSVSIDAALEQNDATNNRVSLTANLYNAASNAAITSIKIFDGDDPASLLQQYSTVSLYGIAAYGTTPLKAPKAVGGDIIQTDGTYWYHAFINTGAFVPATGLSADILVVAGGGGSNSGGSGAGGYQTFTSQSLTSGTSYNCTIGAGGGSWQTTASNGVNSQFGSLTASVGGGSGGNAGNGAGSNGGSGGGSRGNDTTGGQGTVGTATSGQGNNGGNGWGFNGGYIDGGGGGAGAVGGSPAQYATTGGAGGVGLYTAISGGATTGLGELSGGNYYFAGGGGGSKRSSGGTGGAGGLGGGGKGGNDNQNGGAGLPNTGGGGGDGGYYTSPTYYAGAGGSGVIIVRYAV